MKKNQKSTKHKKLTLTVANPLTKEQEKNMVEALATYIQKLYYS